MSEQLRTEILRLLPNLDPASVLVAHDGARGDRLHEPKLRNGERTRVLYCGSLHPGKGVETLIAAAQQFPDSDFHVIGGAPEQITQKTEERRVVQRCVSTCGSWWRPDN